MTQIIKEQNQLEKLHCIIYDRFMSFEEAVACYLKLPSIILRTSSAANFLTFYVYPRFQEEGYIPLQGMSTQHSLSIVIISMLL